MEPDHSLQDDLAAQEAAARTWQPEIEGPRVGDKTPIDAITAEYAKADPVYIAKTMALPQSYTHYRPVKGDGNCGWRAIGFCYFELLIKQGSQEVVQGEQLRLSQLNDYLVNKGGYDPDMFMDFIESTFELFKDISDNIHSPETALSILTSTFNGDASMGILYHLRLLAASWLKGNRDQYEAWCEAGIEGYCASMIEPPDREIEELGIVLLVEVLLKPVGFILEIAYLDRSAGTEVNTHRFPETNDSLGPFVHLLYRPGHYDILYKPTAVEYQVNRVSFEPATFASVATFTPSYAFNPLAMLPGGGAMDTMASLGQLGQPMPFAPTEQASWYPSSHPDTLPSPVKTPSDPCAYTEPLTIPEHSQSTSPSSAIPTTPSHSIRFSRYQFEEPMDSKLWPEQTVQTSTFKNSHFNKAHYNNPDFTPEEYRPDADDEIERVERPRKRSQGKASPSSAADSDTKRDFGP
ncbi:peptidase C65 Otubain-domain-containing protein [Coniella lustricola]|uniref:ubiquitinyl hydrolase 1 n=1 Tax=Coniella lustricola TaxID=2025994 RepID=A0A2T3ALF4_9PEZI|nr:peptidase C65 Otubain-domain-containing protein [Coniella lustricola]